MSNSHQATHGLILLRVPLHGGYAEKSGVDYSDQQSLGSARMIGIAGSLLQDVSEPSMHSRGVTT